MAGTVTFRLGTRGSMLARRQATLVAAEMEQRFSPTRVAIKVIKTSGDKILDRPLYEEGGKGLFVKEIEQALIEGKVDFAVHSCKDIPVTMPLTPESSLVIAALPVRADPRDLLISTKAATIDDLPQAATVATGSLRRQCQLLARRPDLKIVPIRGNIDSRLKKLQKGEFDALILAAAGIERAGLFDPDFMHPIPLELMLPAPAQGALALQCRGDDAALLPLLVRMDDKATRQCVMAERELVRLLEADCHSPIAALAELEGSNFRLRAAVGGRDGQPPVSVAQSQSPLAQYATAIANVHRDLRDMGLMDRLHGSK